MERKTDWTQVNAIIAQRNGGRARPITVTEQQAIEFLPIISSSAILPGDWPAAACRDGRHGLHGPCACPAQA